MSTRRGSTSQAVRQPRAPRPPAPPKPPKPMSAAQRDRLARQGIAKAIGATDDKAAIIAALEAVHERLASDTDLKDSVRQKYREISDLLSGAGSRPKSDLGPVPVPIRSGTPEGYNPYGKFDPYQLAWEYGNHQLPAVLVRGTQRDLREAVGIVEARNPGEKAPRSKNADMIEYILKHLAHLGY